MTALLIAVGLVLAFNVAFVALRVRAVNARETKAGR